MEGDSGLFRLEHDEVQDYRNNQDDKEEYRCSQTDFESLAGTVETDHDH